MVKAAVFFTVLLASLPVFALNQLTAQLDKNPALAENLGISIRQAPEGEVLAAGEPLGALLGGALIAASSATVKPALGR